MRLAQGAPSARWPVTRALVLPSDAASLSVNACGSPSVPAGLRLHPLRCLLLPDPRPRLRVVMLFPLSQLRLRANDDFYKQVVSGSVALARWHLAACLLRRLVPRYQGVTAVGASGIFPFGG